MDALTRLERAALQSIASETPDLTAALARQLEVVSVTARTNTGAGFLTTLAVPAGVTPVASPRVLGQETHAHVRGLREGLGFLLFMKDGHMQALEGFAWGADSTAALDLGGLEFEIFRTSVPRIG